MRYISRIVTIGGIYVLGGLLTACGGPPTAAPTAVAPTAVAPTAAPPTAAPPTAAAPTAAPTAVPTAVPVSADPLPAPLYVLERGQVVRIERDGTTKTTLTAEQPFTADALAIIGLSVSPSDGTLAYVLQGDNGNDLILTDGDGANRRVLLDDVALNEPRWSPDGSALAVKISPPLDRESPWQSGIWAVSAVSGEATLLLADDPYPSDLSAEAWGYLPLRWSPDGSKLLVGRYSQTVEIGEVAILDIASGQLTIPQSPDPRLRVQSSGTWTNDSSGVYVVLRAPALSPPEPGLYLADASSGALTTVLPTNSPDGQLIVAQTPFTGSDGELYVLASLSERIPDPTDDPAAMPLAAGLYAVEDAGALRPLSAESLILFGMPVAAPDGSGVLVPSMTSDGGVMYVFVNLNGAMIELPLEPTADIYWGM